MPVKPQSVISDVNKMKASEILNAVRSESSVEYQNQVPRAVAPGETLPNGRIATQEDAVMTLRGIGNIITSYQPLRDQFVNVLYNRIARVIVTSRLYENPWSFVKKGMMEYGETIEEIFVSIAKPFQFDPEVAEEKVFKRVLPDIRARFHSMNYQKFYKVTVTTAQLRTAFLSWNGIIDLINRIIESLYTAANYDEFMVMKYLIARVALQGYIYPFQIPEVNADNARSVTTQMVGEALNFQFMDTKYNAAGVLTYTDPRYLYTFLTTDISALFDVEVLALSFNMNKAELLGRQVLVDGFGTLDNVRLSELFADDPYTIFTPFSSDELTKLKSIKAIMCDVNWFMIFDNLYDANQIYNPEGLYWNHFYHTWKTFSVSPFANAIMFTTEESATTAITVTPDAPTVSRGSQTAFTASATGTGFANQRVHWEVSGSESDSTINQEGILTVGKGETATSLTVTATSLQSPDVSGTATVTIQ